jgi:hypothetical protein
MIRTKWQEIVGRIKDNFNCLDQGKENLDEDGGTIVEYIVFESPLGRFRLEFVEKPAVLDKHTTYSKRIGSETSVSYVYSEEEKVGQLTAYRWESETWEEMDPKLFADN